MAARVDADLGSRFVVKWARTGYDGKGVFIADAPQPLSTRLDDSTRFCKATTDRGGTVFAEPYVPFRRELALVACRGLDGAFSTYPLVIIEQPKGICRWVKGPATALGVDARLEREAVAYAQRVAQTFDLRGTFAIELFELETGELWVKIETSPRVHNSGHFSQDAAVTSQFENHWRALLGLPLGDVGTQSAFAMLNLLGPDNMGTKRIWRLPPDRGASAFALVRQGRFGAGSKPRSHQRSRARTLPASLHSWCKRWSAANEPGSRRPASGKKKNGAPRVAIVMGTSDLGSADMQRSGERARAVCRALRARHRVGASHAARHGRLRRSGGRARPAGDHRRRRWCGAFARHDRRTRRCR